MENSPKIVELIAQDKNEKLQYEGRCKVIIDTLSKLMLIEPVNEEYKLISALFTWNFVAQKNILFVFSNIQSQDFGLIFYDSHRCQKVYDTLLKKGATSGNKELIHERFLPSLLNEISKNDDSTSKMKLILAEWIERHNGKQRKDLILLLKDNNVYDLIFPNGDIRSRKRKLSSDVPAHKGENQSCKKVNSANFTHVWHSVGIKNCINETINYEMYECVQNGKIKQKLVLFTSSERTHCYEYWKVGMDFRCCFCTLKRKCVTAMIIHNNGKNTVKLNGVQHVCEPRKIIEESMFEMVSYKSGEIWKRRLIIYLDSQRLQCYHYSFIEHSQKYHCISCQRKKCYTISATICREKNGKDFVILDNTNHICQIRQDRSVLIAPKKKKEQNGKIVEAPNFEFLKYSRSKKGNKPWLIVFLDDSHTKCYEYSWNAQLKSYDCLGCQQKNKHRSTTKICQKDDGTKYIIIPENHICEIRTFNREKFLDDEKQIVKAPNYEIQKYFFRGKERSKILIFASADKSLWYEYTWSKKKTVMCSGCIKKNENVTAKICHSDDGTEYLKLNKFKHVCEPKSMKHAKEIVEKPNFEVKEQKDAEGRNLSKLLIFTSSEKTAYYEYSWSISAKKFYCSGCTIKVDAEILQRDDGTDYVILSKTKHVCDPRETANLDLKSSNEIVESPNFKVLKYKHKGKEFSRLILFDPSNKQLCYDYFWKENQKVYICSRCPFENRVTAILCKNAEGKEYLQLENSNHTCELREFDPEKYMDDVIIKKPMYEFVEYTFKKTKKTALIIFTDLDKKFCYSMFYRKDRNGFYCTRCWTSKIWILATVQNEGKADEHVAISSQRHICKPTKFSDIGNKLKHFVSKSRK